MLCCVSLCAHCSINGSNYWHSVIPIHHWTYTGVSSFSPHIFPTKVPASVGFLWVKPHLHPAAKAFLTWEIPQHIAGQQNRPWVRVPMEAFWDLCHVFASTWQNTTSGCLLSRLFLYSQWVLVWLCLDETAVSLDSSGSYQKHSKLTCKYNKKKPDKCG